MFHDFKISDIHLSNLHDTANLIKALNILSLILFNLQMNKNNLYFFLQVSKMGVKMNLRIITKNHAADSKIRS